MTGKVLKNSSGYLRICIDRRAHVVLDGLAGDNVERLRSVGPCDGSCNEHVEIPAIHEAEIKEFFADGIPKARNIVHDGKLHPEPVPISQVPITQPRAYS